MVQQAKRNADTGVPNEQYDLVSILYHSLQSASVCEMYAQDANRSNDSELTEFFQQVKKQCSQQAEQARQLMAKRLG